MSAYSFFIYTSAAGASGLTINSITSVGGSTDYSSLVNSLGVVGTDTNGNSITGYYVDDPSVTGSNFNFEINVTTGNGSEFNVGDYREDGAYSPFEFSGTTFNGSAQENKEYATVIAVETPDTVTSADISTGGGGVPLNITVGVTSLGTATVNIEDMMNPGMMNPGTINIFELKWRDWLSVSTNAPDRTLTVNTDGMNTLGSYPDEATARSQDFYGMEMPGSYMSNVNIGRIGEGAGATTTNSPPVMNASGLITTTDAETGVVFTASATDPDGGVLTYTLTGADVADFTINSATGEVSLSGGSVSTGNKSIQVYATDSSGATSAPYTYTIDVNSANTAPVITGGGTLTHVQGNTGTLIDLSAITNDVDGDPLTYAVTGPGASGIALDINTGVITVPTGTAPGTYNFDVFASDGTATSNVVAYTLTVTANAAPVFTNSLTGTIRNDTGSVIVALTATDTENDPLTFSLTGTGTGAGLFQLTGGNEITLTNTDESTPAGVYTLGVGVTDGFSAVTAELSITVSAVVYTLPRKGGASVGSMGRLGNTLNQETTREVLKSFGNDFSNTTGSPMVITTGDLLARAGTSIKMYAFSVTVLKGTAEMASGPLTMVLNEGDTEERTGADNDDGTLGTVTDTTFTVPDGSDIRIRWQEIE